MQKGGGTLPTLAFALQGRELPRSLPRLRAVMPELITLGTFDTASKMGPAIWIKCMLAKSESGEALLPEANWPAGLVPVVYLPGVGKQALRAIEECPADVKPLAEGKRGHS